MNEGRSLPPEVLVRIATRLLSGCGAEPEAASLVADSLVGASLRGIDSHGIVRLPGYLELIRRGAIDPRARPELVRQTPALAIFAGRRSFGQVAAHVATRAATDKAKGLGIGAAALSGVQHVGRLGEFSELAAALGCVSLTFVNSGPPGGLVAPHGGRERRMGTNPLAFGIPAAARPPIVADFSPASATDGKVRMTLNAGQSVPEGWLLDAAGNPTTRPADLYSGGAVLPSAGHKGFALSLLVEILGGLLTGEGCASTGDDPGNGFVMIAIEPSFFAESPFGVAVDQVIDAIEGCPPAAGYTRVTVPGGPELETEKSRRRSGISIDAHTWRELDREADGLGLALESLCNS